MEQLYTVRWGHRRGFGGLLLRNLRCTAALPPGIVIAQLAQALVAKMRETAVLKAAWETNCASSRLFSAGTARGWKLQALQ